MKKILALLVVLSVFILSCGGKGASGKEGSDIEGKILIDGSSTVAPVTQAVAEGFNEDHPNISISIGISGTGGGFKKFTAAETDISNASRTIKEEEAATAAKNGVEYVALQVGIDGITIVVSSENTWANDITTEELKKIWEAGSTIKTWKDVRPEWPDIPISLYAPGEDSGTHDYFMEEVLGKDVKMRIDYNPSTNPNTLVQGVAGDKGALGFFGYAYFEENADKLKALKVNGVAPTADTVQEGTYKPLSRPIFIYVNKKSYAEKPAVKTFVDYYLEVVGDVISEVGYVALKDYSKEIEKLK